MEAANKIVNLALTLARALRRFEGRNNWLRPGESKCMCMIKDDFGPNGFETVMK